MVFDLLSQAWIYVLSFVGLALAPASLNKLRWIYPIWFFLINLLLFTSLEKILSSNSAWYLLFICQLPWIMVTAYICTAASQRLIPLLLEEWVLWGALHLLGLHYFLHISTHRIPLEFLMSTGITESLSGLGAILAFFFLKKRWKGSLYILFFWNTFGLLSSWRFNSDIQLFFFSGPAEYGRREILHYLAGFPQIWLIVFWIPLSLCIHICIFYSMWHNRKALKQAFR